MVGLGGAREGDGDLGPYLDERSSVDAVVVWFATGDLIANSRRSSLETRLLGPPPESALFGREIPADDSQVRAASPSALTHPGAPPFLIGHGDRDRIVMENESRALHESLTRDGADSTLCVLGGAGHEGRKFDSAANIALTAAWLRAHLSSMEQGEGRR